MIRYLSTAEFAERIAVQRGTLSRYRLPEPDALVGTTRGWLPETVDAWNERRPGSGRRKLAGDWAMPRDGVDVEVAQPDEAWPGESPHQARWQG